jgi:hypothetical protein
MMLTTGQRHALELLADAAHGYTVPLMLGRGCDVVALRHLARHRLAVADRVRVPGNRRDTVVRLRISDDGRKALARGNGRRISAKLVLLVLFVVGLLAGVGVGALMMAPV